MTSKPLTWIFAFFLPLLDNFYALEAATGYYGKYIGALKSYHHALGGDVYVVDSRTLHIRNFNYDGEGPAGYFYVSSSKTPNEQGTKIRDEKGTFNPLRKYRKEHITLTLPEGKTVHNIKWFYAWCDEFAVNFGDIRVPKNIDYPKPQKIGKLNGVHGVSSDNIVVVDAQTLLIPGFSYDGDAPDAKFWVGSGLKPSPQGIRVPDENGKEEPLRRYTRKTIVLTLPGDLTVFDIAHFGIWCEAFTVDFGHVQIPRDLNVPPSLKMLGVSPQSKLNCEVLYDDLAFEVRWAVAGDSIVIQLVAKLEKGEYMSFGLSGQIDRNTMVGGDVVVAWVDHDTLNGYVNDYFLDSKSQCAGNHGSCPDVRLEPNTESVRLLNAALVNGYSIVTYQRPLKAQDVLDLPVYTNGSQAVIWAIGPLNSLREVSYHSITSKATILLDFGRTPQWNCPIPESDAAIATTENKEDYREKSSKPNNVVHPVFLEASTTQKVKESAESSLHRKTVVTTSTAKPVPTPATVAPIEPWEIPPIQCYEPEDGVFYAQMGPTGGKRGYSAITGHVGWGISWYINGLLIPEIHVVRGKTYTFVVEGGNNPEIPAKYHPFYITDDPVGGFQHKTPEEKARVQIFAGVIQNRAGELEPVGVGRLCNWTPDPDQPPSDEFLSFGAYQRSLSLVCDHGEPGVIQWTPDENTPDTVYYQCYSHRYLGWKIRVLDSCDKSPASESVTTKAKIEKHSYDSEDPLQPETSINVPTRIKPDNETKKFFHQNGISNDGRTNFQLIPPDLTNNLKQDFIQKEVLQDPFMPPPPYQKIFDYQSMQQIETRSQTKSTTESTKSSTAHGPEITQTLYTSAHRTTPFTKQPVFKTQPYKSNVPLYLAEEQPPYTPKPKLQVTGMHIHVIKHDDPDEDGPLVLGKPQSVRPHAHSLMMKKPNRVVPQKFDPLVRNRYDSQGSASVANKVILAPIKSIPPHGMLIPHNAMSQISKKTYMGNGKREEFKYRIPEPVPGFGGFNPNSIVIEGGFKPIVPTTESQVTAQERMSEDDQDYIEEGTELPVHSTTVNSTNSSLPYVHSRNPFEGKEPELFEPVFIPSPVINEKKRKPAEDRTDAQYNQMNVFYVRHKPRLTSKPAYLEHYSAKIAGPHEEGEIIRGIPVASVNNPYRNYRKELPGIDSIVVAN